MSILPYGQVKKLVDPECYATDDSFFCQDIGDGQVLREDLPVIVTIGQRGASVQRIMPATVPSDSMEFVKSAVHSVKDGISQQAFSDIGPQILHGHHHRGHHHHHQKPHHHHHHRPLPPDHTDSYTPSTYDDVPSSSQKPQKYEVDTDSTWGTEPYDNSTKSWNKGSPGH